LLEIQKTGGTGQVVLIQESPAVDGRGFDIKKIKVCKSLSRPAQFPQHPGVFPEGIAEGWLAVIWKMISQAGGLYDGCQFPVVNMTDIGKEVVFDLKI
jgi:hypothetical protein